MSNIFSTEGIMRSIENLTLPLSTFQMTDEQRIEIESRMRKCSECRKWKRNEDLVDSMCSEHWGVSFSKKKAKDIDNNFKNKNNMSEKIKTKERGKRRKFDDETKKQILREYFNASRKKEVLLKWNVSAANISIWKGKFGENPQPGEQAQIDFDKPVDKKKLGDKKVIIIEVEEDGDKTIMSCSHSGFKNTVDLIGALETTKLNLLIDKQG